MDYISIPFQYSFNKHLLHANIDLISEDLETILQLWLFLTHSTYVG